MLRRVHHLSLAEGKVLAVLEDEQVSQDLGDLIDGARLDFLQVFPVALVPCLLVDRDVAGPQDLVDFRDLLGRDELAHPDGLRRVGRNHDLHPVPKDLHHVELLPSPHDLPVFDRLDEPDSLRWINGQFPYFEHLPITTSHGFPSMTVH